jgi:putative endonuclease
VDIVCRQGKTLTFVEVKTRTSTALGRPAEAVNAKKESLILRGARSWLRMLPNNGGDINVRCDVMEVILINGEKPELNVIEGAFRLEK